jgi:hypothetical protein
MRWKTKPQILALKLWSATTARIAGISDPGYNRLSIAIPGAISLLRALAIFTRTSGLVFLNGWELFGSADPKSPFEGGADLRQGMQSFCGFLVGTENQLAQRGILPLHQF